MFRNAFKEFQSPTRKRPALFQPSDCTLNDSMFRKSIHWCIKNIQDIEHQKSSFEKVAKQYNAVLFVWRIHTTKDQNYNIIQLKSMHDITKLPEFLNRALQVSKAIFIREKFKLLSICVINKYGSFEAEQCSSVCKDCGQAQRLSECCAQFKCNKCSKTKKSQNCLLCHKYIQVKLIPSQTVESCQSKYIYQPMFPNLSLEDRFQLMDFVDAELNYD